MLYLPYIAEYLIYLLSNSKLYINNSKIKNLNKRIHEVNGEEEKNSIQDKIEKLKEKNRLFIERQNKRNEKAYKIKITKNNNVKYLIIIMIICILTGFLTPIGTTPYTYLVKTMQGNTTKNINEHLPLTLIYNVNYMIVLIVFLGILTFTDTKIRLCDLFMLGGLTFLTFYTKRQETMFFIICMFILNRLVFSLFNKYAPEAVDKAEKIMTGILGTIITITIILTLCVINYKPKVDDDYISKSSYPIEASDYILSNLDLKNIKLYNEYNYGSYLLYRGIPVFIDSRADLYTPEFNEGVNIFNDFLTISGVNTQDIEELIDKYEFTHFIMYKNAKLRTFLDRTPDKYENIYEDDNFCIYERK